MTAALPRPKDPRMAFEYKPPSRLSALLRSGPLFWLGLLAVALAFGAYAWRHL